MKYEFEATFEERDNIVYARVPDLPGCITTGKAVEDAVDMIVDAASLWLVVAEDHSDPIPSASKINLEHTVPNVFSRTIQIDTDRYRAGLKGDIN